MPEPTSDRESRRPGAPRAWLAAATFSLLLALAFAASRRGPETVFRGESEFGTVRVVEREDGLRALYIGAGRARQSAVYPGRPRHLELAYTRVAAVGLALVPADARILYVGLGGGAMPMFARQILPDARIEAVEIDPVVVDVARAYFGVRPDARLTVHTGDGRAFIEAAPAASYDLVVLDAFSDDEIPEALTTRQFLAAVRSRLAPGGVVVSNLWSGNPVYAAMVATYQCVFDEVHLLRVPGHAQRILVAGAEARPLELPTLLRASRELAARADLGFDLPRLVEQGYEAPPARPAPVLVDTPSAVGQRSRAPAGACRSSAVA